MSPTIKTIVTYLVLATAVIGGLGPSVAQLAGVLPPSYLTLAVHAVAVCAAIHLWLIQSPLVQPLLATKKTTPVVPMSMLAIAAFGGCMAATQIPVIIGGGETLVNCVTGEIAKGDDTFEGIASACGATAIAEVVGIVETLATTSAPAKAVHHKVSK